MKKKVLAAILVVACAAALTACGSKEEPASSSSAASAASASSAVSEVSTSSAVSESASVVSESTAPEAAVMTHAEYVEAEIDSLVCVETYVQAKQGWWENEGVGVASIYAESEDGAYFLYNLPCSQEDYDNLLVPGAKIKVTGYKAEWSGETEIIDATYEVVEGAESFIAEAMDVTDLLGKDELIDHQNQFVAFKGLTIAPSKDGNGNEAAFLYKWDGSGQDGDDLYFNVAAEDGSVYNFTVESYLCGPDTDVYQAVKALKVGDVCDMEGFLYWYEGANPHITSVVVK